MSDAMFFALRAHGDQRYGDHLYSYHLSAVAQVLVDFGFTSSLWADAAWLHDVLEDTDTRWQELWAAFGRSVTELVIACTGEGCNRAEQQANIREKIRHSRRAAILKIADRIANVEEAGRTKSRYRASYLKEADSYAEVFKEAGVPKGMLARLEKAYEAARG